MIIENFKLSTSVLIERIKDLEANQTLGFERPQTAQVMSNICKLLVFIVNFIQSRARANGLETRGPHPGGSKFSMSKRIGSGKYDQTQWHLLSKHSARKSPNSNCLESTMEQARPLHRTKSQRMRSSVRTANNSSLAIRL